MTLEYLAMRDYAEQTAKQTAEYIISAARDNPGPVVFVTSNSCMPPARSFAGADKIYWASPDLWEAYWEDVEERLSKAQVMTSCPDWDNAIYAVDLARWQHIDADLAAGDSLDDEWEPVDAT